MNEREAIVAWLRNKSQNAHKLAADETANGDQEFAAIYIHGSAAYANAADEIERGDHLKGKSDER
ncbi:hypothetical protein C7451_106168 [Blastomonas natatoria]|uniref:Uncharacterized protein n=1 Tax=Blastomonas natatoria TaxID=34015 RepID=A0A2V3V4H3_9SPHN|nr:hypothetical protein [Blastomonas natatoria]PXW76004.1 hypothetical protein C7451_106168 [Blastomonas natatoria]